MKNHYRHLALLISCALVCTAPMSALCSEAAPAGETAAAAEIESAEEYAAPGGAQAEEAEEIIEEIVDETSNAVDVQENSIGDTEEESVIDGEPEEAEEPEASQPEEEASPVTEGYCGEELTWEELSEATWCVGASVTSNAGYSFPYKWLLDNYGKTINDLPHVVQGNYAEAFARAAAEQVDIIVCYADGRTDYEEDWETPTDKETSKGAGFGREASIWEECNVIGVTDNIYNDTIAITKANPEVYNEDFINAFCDSMLAICETQEGKDIISIYTHEGYLRATDADYDAMRDALAAVQE